jgi:hypothetical protein
METMHAQTRSVPHPNPLPEGEGTAVGRSYAPSQVNGFGVRKKTCNDEWRSRKLCAWWRRGWDTAPYLLKILGNGGRERDDSKT